MVSPRPVSEDNEPMKYMLMVYSPEQAWTDEERKACMSESATLCHRLAGEGHYLVAAPLQSIRTATTLRIRNGKRLLTDGPFAETTEQLGGFYLIEAADLDEAIAVASRIPGASVGSIEIRPVVELSGMPERDVGISR